MRRGRLLNLLKYRPLGKTECDYLEFPETVPTRYPQLWGYHAHRFLMKKVKIEL